MPIDREGFNQFLKDRAYHTALICDNGHILSSNLAVELSPPSHCPNCGTHALQHCPGCGKPIRGPRSTSPGFAPWPPPAFCHDCGEAFPWTKARSQALLELAAEAEEFDDDDLQVLKELLPDLGIDGPRTELAALKARRLLLKLSGGAKDAIYRAMVDICSETAAKLLKSGGL